MQSIDERVVGHYDRSGLEERVLAALREHFGELSGLDPADLNALDEFHIRGRESTEELAARLALPENGAVLDIGCGLGGTVRYLASRGDCRVTGIDLTPGYIALAEKLSAAVGLADRTEFRCASATGLPFEDGRFDMVWMAHVQMNIEDKAQLAREILRVLRPGGRFAMHEIFGTTGRQPRFPVPWSDGPEGSFLVSPEDFRAELERAGLRTEVWEDVSRPSLDWASSTIERLRETGPPPVGLHLLMGEDAPIKLNNVRHSLEEGRIRVMQGVFARP